MVDSRVRESERASLLRDLMKAAVAEEVQLGDSPHFMPELARDISGWMDVHAGSTTSVDYVALSGSDSFFSRVAEPTIDDFAVDIVEKKRLMGTFLGSCIGPAIMSRVVAESDRVGLEREVEELNSKALADMFDDPGRKM